MSCGTLNPTTPYDTDEQMWQMMMMMMLYSTTSSFCSSSQDDRSPDNVKFPDIPWQFAAHLPMLSLKCYSYHAGTGVIVSGVVGLGMQQCMIPNQNEMLKFSKVKNGCKYAANNKKF